MRRPIMTDPKHTIVRMTDQEIRLIALMSQRPLDIWTAIEIVRFFPFSPSHDLTKIASSLMDKGLVLVQRTRAFDDTPASSGLALTAAGVKVGFELARRRLAVAPEQTPEQASEPEDDHRPGGPLPRRSTVLWKQERVEKNPDSAFKGFP